MKLKKAIATLTALCLLLCGTLGALAEDDVVLDLLNYFLGDKTEQTQDVPQPEEAPAEEDYAEDDYAGEDYAEDDYAGEDYAEDDYAGEDYAEDDYADEEGAEDGEVYVFDEEEEEIVVDELVQVDDYAVNENLPDNWTNILLLGTDSRGSNKYLRTDTMIMLSINRQTNEAKLTSFLRDTWVEIPGYEWQKLNAACVYGGPELTLRIINQYYGLNLEYYALVNMQCLVEIVESLGGVRLDISRAEAGAMNRLIKSDAETRDGNRRFATAKVHSGEQVLLNGKQTLCYMRIRKLDTDYARTGRQRKVLTTIAHELQKKNIFALTSLVTSMLQYVETNLTFDEIMNIVAVCMKTDLNSLTDMQIPAEGTFEAGMFGTTWCIKPDFEANAALLRQFIYGE